MNNKQQHYATTEAKTVYCPGCDIGYTFNGNSHCPTCLENIKSDRAHNKEKRAKFRLMLQSAGHVLVQESVFSDGLGKWQYADGKEIPQDEIEHAFKFMQLPLPF